MTDLSDLYCIVNYDDYKKEQCVKVIGYTTTLDKAKESIFKIMNKSKTYPNEEIFKSEDHNYIRCINPIVEYRLGQIQEQSDSDLDEFLCLCEDEDEDDVEDVEDDEYVDEDVDKWIVKYMSNDKKPENKETSIKPVIKPSKKVSDLFEFNKSQKKYLEKSDYKDLLNTELQSVNKNELKNFLKYLRRELNKNTNMLFGVSDWLPEIDWCCEVYAIVKIKSLQNVAY